MSAVLKLFDGLYDNPNLEPDNIEYDRLNIEDISKDFIISRDVNGNMLSTYGDNIWDLSPYRSNPSQHAIINFKTRIKVESYIQESKKLVLLLFLFGSGRNGSKYSTETMLHYFNDTIFHLAEYSKQRKITMFEILENNKILKHFISEKCIHNNKTQSISSLLVFLNNQDNKITKINFKKDSEIFLILQSLLKDFSKNTTQTSVIPSRILFESTRQRWEQVSEIKNDIDNIVLFLQQFLKDEQVGISSKTYHDKFQEMGDNAIPWEEIVRDCNLHNLFAKYNIRNRRMFQGFITSIYGTIKHLIHMYTGMRNGEVLSLRNNCIELKSTESGVCHIISTTSKLEGTNKKVRWTTTKDLVDAIIILNKINETIASHYEINIADMPLFIKSSLISANNKTTIDLSVLEKRKFSETAEFPIMQEILKITHDDRKEIEEINYNLDTEELKVGELWKFKTHQYRRSLVVYSLQSGLVSLGAMQIQLKHLFREMTLYYGNGASYAKKLFDIPKDHIANDFNKLQPELDALAYIKNAIFSDEQLFGTHGTFLEKNIKNNRKQQEIYLLENREKTIKQFKNGEIAYKETAIGGCISTEDCDFALTRSIVACGGCDSSIVKKSKLDNIILEQRKYIDTYLDKDSPEYRAEMADLKILEEQRKSFLGSKA